MKINYAGPFFGLRAIAALLPRLAPDLPDLTSCEAGEGRGVPTPRIHGRSLTALLMQDYSKTQDWIGRGSPYGQKGSKVIRDGTYAFV